MKYIKLTGIGEVLTKSTEEKLEKENDYQIPKCSNGLTEEQYLDLGIDLPNDLIEKIKKQEEGVELKDEDFEKILSEVLIPQNQIKLIVDSEDFTTIFLNDGLTVNVLETVSDINLLLMHPVKKMLNKIINLFNSNKSSTFAEEE